MSTYNWNAADYFQRLTAANRFARKHDFFFARVAGASGMEEMLAAMQSQTAFVCVSDTATGYTEINNSPYTRRTKTVFLVVRHAIDDAEARQEAFDIARELFRQFMSHLILERTRLEQQNVYLDPRITFTEVPEYAFSGCAVASFTIAVTTYTDLRFNQDEWNTTNP